MAKPSAEKPDPSKPPGLRVLPMQLQIGDRLCDETGEYEVIGRPYDAMPQATRPTRKTASRSLPFAAMARLAALTLMGLNFCSRNEIGARS